MTTHQLADECLFCKIIAGVIPSKKLYEDEEILAFHDINPWAPIHFLVIPKKHIASLAHITPDDTPLMGRMMAKIPELALLAGCQPYPEGGYRVTTNTGRQGGQEIHHLHFHVMGGPRPWLKG
jgi:histidine triad (HIT) family protein